MSLFLIWLLMIAFNLFWCYFTNEKPKECFDWCLAQTVAIIWVWILS